MDKVNRTSMAVNDERLKQLMDLFPEAISEGKIDFDKLRQTLGEHIDSRPERYSFTWAGKRDAMQAAQIPSQATLVPDREASVNFNETQNVFIEGDNLEVLKLLARPYFGRVKMIYIDPPYNTGKEFIYPDNYSQPLDNYLRMTGQKNGNGDILTTNTDTSGRYHSKWLSMMYPRLFLARQMLSNDGVIFVSIDDNELQNLLFMLNEIFGEANFVGLITWRNVTDNNPTLINKDNEFIVCYSRSKVDLPQAWRSLQSDAKTLLQKEYERLKEKGISLEKIEEGIRQFISDNSTLLDTLTRYNKVDEQGIYTGSESVHNPRAGGYDFEVIHPITKKNMRKPANGYRFPEETFRKMQDDGVILYGEDENRIVKIKKYLSDYEDTLRSIIVVDGRLGSYDLKRVFDTSKNLFSNPKPVDLLAKLVSFVTEPNSSDIVLDFFAGSATLGHALYQLNSLDEGNRRFILIQIPHNTDDEPAAKKAGYETISQLAIARLRKASKYITTNTTSMFDSGFRAFRLTESNYSPDPDPEALSEEAYAEQLALWADSLLVDGWDATDVIYEVALKEGYGLKIRVEEVSVESNTVYHVTDPDKEQSFYICLDETLRTDIIDALGLTPDDLFICHDKALDDTLAANLALQARLQTL